MPSPSRSTSHSTLQNFAIILLSAFSFPLLTTITLLCSLISPFLPVSKHIYHHRRWRSLSSSTFRPRTILITDLQTPQALSLARIFYRAGHRVVGGGYEPYYLPIPAHFSRSVEVFYRLGKREGQLRNEKYARDLVDAVRKEKVELWANCSGGDGDLEGKEVLERETRCQVLQFGRKVRELLGDEALFEQYVRKLGLNAPETHLVTSGTEALAVFSREKSDSAQEKQYIVKSVSTKDTTSSDVTLVPLLSLREVQPHTKTLNPTPTSPLTLQESAPGLQYSTHALIINSKPAAFVAYPSSLTQLTPLPASSLLSLAMLQYTTLLTSKLSPSTTTSIAGHLSLAFAVPSHLALASESKFGVPDSEVHDLVTKIYAIKGSTTPGLGAMAFADVSEDLAFAYLSILPDPEPRGISNGHWEERLVVPKPGIQGHCFLGHEVVSLVLLPVWGWVRRKIGVEELLGGWVEFLGRLWWWRDGWWEVWDPWVAWWAYGGNVAGSGVVGLWEGRGYGAEGECT